MIFLLFIVVPIIEISIFITVGSNIGILNTIAIILTTAIVGIFLVRRQGIKLLFDAQKNLSQGIMPTEEIKGGIFLLVSGLLLITPGFFTDTIGFLGLIPVTRTLMIRLVQTTMMKRYNVHQDDTIEGEYIDLDDDGDQKN